MVFELKKFWNDLVFATGFQESEVRKEFGFTDKECAVGSGKRVNFLPVEANEMFGKVSAVVKMKSTKFSG